VEEVPMGSVRTEGKERSEPSSAARLYGRRNTDKIHQEGGWIEANGEDQNQDPV